MTTPAPGTFIRPVGGFLYCLEIRRVFEEPGESTFGVECMRWGMQDGQPVKDGHQNLCWISGLKQIAPGIIKDEWPYDTPRWMSCPLYYRRIDVGGQMGLFA